MGRAAAVRAATKSKTDARKAKINAVFGKRIIMAVKSGGSPDPVANRALADVIKHAKANSVPVEVSRSLCVCMVLFCFVWSRVGVFETWTRDGRNTTTLKSDDNDANKLRILPPSFLFFRSEH
jgi:hypothetical protein